MDGFFIRTLLGRCRFKCTIISREFGWNAVTMQQLLSKFRRLKIQTKLVVYYITFVVIFTGIMIFFAYHQTVQSLQVTIDQENALLLARQIAIRIGILGLPISMLLIAVVMIMAQRITAPLRTLSETVSHITDG